MYKNFCFLYVYLKLLLDLRGILDTFKIKLQYYEY